MEKTILEAIEDSKSQVGAQVAELSAQLKRKSPKERQQLVDGWQVEHKRDVIEISGKLSELAGEEKRERMENLMLHSLDFPQLRDHHETIAKAHPATFDWIFDANPDQSVSWINFANWLSGSHGTDSLY